MRSNYLSRCDRIIAAIVSFSVLQEELLSNYLSRCSEKFFNGNFVRNKDEIAIKLALGEVFFCRSQLSAQTIFQFLLFQALIA